RVVVLSGSLGSSLALWDLQAPALAEGFRVLRYDHPGHGRSLLSDDRTIEALAAQLLELLDDLGFARVSFCGLSLGGAGDVRGALGAVQAPTMAIAGADDHSTPPDELKAIAAEIPSARLTVLDGRHLVNVEQADAFNEALLAHLES